MQISKVDSNNPNIKTYEVIDPETQEGVFYIAVDNKEHITNIIAPEVGGNLNKVDATILKYRTEVPLIFNKDGILILQNNDELVQLLIDLLGVHAVIVSKDLNLELTPEQVAEFGLALNEIPDQTTVLNKYNSDPYEGMFPQILDYLNNAGAESPANSLGGSDFSMDVDTDIEPDTQDTEDEETVPPEEGEEEVVQ